MNSAQHTEKENISKPEADIEALRNLEKSSSSLLASANKEDAESNQGSVISLSYLKMGASNSSYVMETLPEEPEEPKESKEKEKNLRVQIYRPISPFSPLVTAVMAPAPPTHKAIIEEPQIEYLASAMHVAVVEEPKVEILPPSTYRAVIEEPKIGIIRTSDGNEIIILSDDDDILNAYESAGEIDSNDHHGGLCGLTSVQAMDSQCCSRTRTRSRLRERETQTPKNRVLTHTARPRITQSPQSYGVIAGPSSKTENSDQKLQINSHPATTFKQRQLELHRHRIAVEQKRLELLELKLARERDEMLRERILFEKELDLKVVKLRKLTEDCIDL